MRSLRSAPRSAVSLRTASRAAAMTAIGSVLLGVALVLTAGPAGSAQACGQYSYGFVGTRLINDGISTSAGPFSIALPAGTYEIAMVSHDNHPSADYQTDQTQEQWFFRLDNGFESSLTDDIPNDGENVTTTIAAQTLAAATSISVHHAQLGVAPNSVDVVCVGFTPIQVSPPTSSVSPPASSVSPPTTAVSPPTSAISPPPTQSVGPASTIAPIVKGVVEPRPPVLAVTGAWSSELILVAAAAIVLGGLSVALSHAATSRTAQRQIPAMRAE